MYIYGIRSPKLVGKVKLDNGDVVDVARYAYAYKPLYESYWSYGRKGRVEPRWQVLAKARLIRMENIWDKFINGGGKYPKAGVMVHGDGDNTINVGSHVMTWPQLEGRVPKSIEDCTCNDATYIGKVAEVLA